jgi:hypothetical protein
VSSVDVATALGMIRARIDRDFADPALDVPSITFTSYPEWVASSAVSTSPSDQPWPPVADLVCVCGGHSFPFNLDDGVETAVAHIASALQDDAMDHLNRPWPRVGVDQVVLEPRVDEQGLAVWASRDGSVACPVGYLSSTFGAVGHDV